ncbi:uncharacterized protein LOC111525246 isoform X3 [Piliocolobus tephrosceles]|uniref:uncharacterized protein LOC111525246 isoform X3 n=1 Tax=Piliocolobus tephrosceles TaxID=591936 RepID=UPI000C299098|nr:uncharacterized protein LOC111525246 isoform X3 [Piliocolobus tephrosceles]XP_023046328.1 uncharacterized protein LOC111525246 isoform X3 [Piliocolobus tephrosceles]
MEVAAQNSWPLVLDNTPFHLSGSSKTCPACSLLRNCTEITCRSAQDSCLFSQIQLENGTLIEKGSCVAPGECQEGVYALTYGPHASLWVSTACCENNCSSLPQQEAGPKAKPNTVKCHYCSGNMSASCDSLLVMNCTGKQTACVTLNGTWSRGGPQILKGCATPEVCNLHENATLGPEDSGFHLTAKPECNYLTPPTQPGPHATVTHAKAETTTCFTCSDLHSCGPLPCPEDNNYCLQMAGITDFGEGNPVSWRNGFCVTSKDCKFGNSIYALTYGVGFGFWVNTTCCQGNCQEPAPLATHLASDTLSEILCPTCPGSSLEPCNSSFYMQCPSGETECVQLDLTSEEGGRNVSVRGCGSRDLCSALDWTHGLPVLPRHRLSSHCSPGRRAVLESHCRSGAAPGLRLTLPVLAVVLATATLS